MIRHKSKLVINSAERRAMHGFTIIELMIVLVIAAIALGLALPSFSNLIRNNELATARDSLLDAFQFARSEAVSRNTEVSICPSNNGATCTAGASWADGWIIYADTGVGLNSTIGQVLKVVQETKAIQATHNAAMAGLNPALFVRYEPQGFAAYLAPISAQNICFSTRDGSAKSRGIAIATGTGQVRPIGAC